MRNLRLPQHHFWTVKVFLDGTLHRWLKSSRPPKRWRRNPSQRRERFAQRHCLRLHGQGREVLNDTVAQPARIHYSVCIVTENKILMEFKAKHSSVYDTVITENKE